MIREVMNVAEAEGYPMDDDVIEQNIEGTRKMPPTRTAWP